MSDSKPVSMPSHLWEALEQMSSEMGVDADALVSQAVFTLARLNGFVVPGKAAASSGAAAPAPAPAMSKPAARPGRPPAPARRPEPEPEPEPLPEPEPEQPEDQYDQPGDDYLPDNQGEDYPPEPEPEPEPAPPPPARGGRATLTLFVAGRDPFKMTTDAFTIGRGKTCDFVIESNRVSREHCRILREGADFTLEDLNSSNGTFLQSGEKLAAGKKLKLKDGDEFKLGTEKIKFQIRK